MCLANLVSCEPGVLRTWCLANLTRGRLKSRFLWTKGIHSQGQFNLASIGKVFFPDRCAFAPEGTPCKNTEHSFCPPPFAVDGMITLWQMIRNKLRLL